MHALDFRNDRKGKQVSSLSSCQDTSMDIIAPVFLSDVTALFQISFMSCSESITTPEKQFGIYLVSTIHLVFIKGKQTTPSSPRGSSEFCGINTLCTGPDPAQPSLWQANHAYMNIKIWREMSLMR